MTNTKLNLITCGIGSYDIRVHVTEFAEFNEKPPAYKMVFLR